MTEERMQMLEEQRSKASSDEMDRSYTGRLVQGVKLIEEGLAPKIAKIAAAQKEREAVAVLAGVDQKNKGQKRREPRKR